MVMSLSASKKGIAKEDTRAPKFIACNIDEAREAKKAFRKKLSGEIRAIERSIHGKPSKYSILLY